MMESRRYLSGHRAIERPVAKIDSTEVEVYKCPECKKTVEEPRIWIGTMRWVVPVLIRDINVLRAEHKYVEVWTAKGKVGLTEISMEKLSETFPNEWLQVHRNTLVRLTEIVRVEAPYPDIALYVKGCPTKISVSRRRWKVIRSIIGMNSFSVVTEDGVRRIRRIHI